MNIPVDAETAQNLLEIGRLSAAIASDLDDLHHAADRAALVAAGVATPAPAGLDEQPSLTLQIGAVVHRFRSFQMALYAAFEDLNRGHS